MLEPRRPPPLLPLPSEAEAAENRLSSSEMSISGALYKTIIWNENNRKPHATQ